MDVRDTLRRRLLYLLVPLGTVLLLSILAAYLLPERFASFSTVIVQRESAPADAQASGADPLGLFMEIVRSHATLEAAADTLLASSRGGDREAQVALLARSIVTEERGTDACRITASAGDPETAQRMADAVTGAAIRISLQTDLRRLNEAVRFYEQKLSEYHSAPAGTEPPAAGRTAAPGAVDRAALARTAGELQAAQVSLGATERSLAALRSSVESLDDPATLSRLAALDTRTAGPFVANIRSLATRYADLLTRYRPLHPEVQSVRRQLAGLIAKTVSGLEADRDALRVQIADLGMRERQLRFRAAAAESVTENPVRVSEAGVPRDVVAGLQHELEQARVARDLRERSGNRVSVLDRPQRPSAPVSPDRPLIIMIGGLTGLLLGVAALAVAESLDATIRRAGDLEIFGKPVIATLP
jgi:polysaccharide biosynthesis transport protein